MLEFKNQGTADIYAGQNSQAASKILDSRYHKKARLVLDFVKKAKSQDDLKVIPGCEYEELKADRAGQTSLRFNKRLPHRIVFTWTPQGAVDVEIVDYH